MTYITINQLSPEYASILFQYFSILNRHELTQYEPHELTDNDDHGELCLPTSTYIIDGNYEYELIFDIDDKTHSSKFVAKFNDLEGNDASSHLIEVVKLDHTSFIGYSIGIPSEMASQIIKFMAWQSIAISHPITNTFRKTLWN